MTVQGVIMWISSGNQPPNWIQLSQNGEMEILTKWMVSIDVRGADLMAQWLPGKKGGR
jgi:hypothetical protein